MAHTDENSYCQITLAGSLDPSWSDWLGGLEISSASGEQGQKLTILRGVVPDQAVLRGILARVWDLGLNLVTVQLITHQDNDETREG
jgi:hypothetical protein